MPLEPFLAHLKVTNVSLAGFKAQSDANATEFLYNTEKKPREDRVMGFEP